MMRPMMINMKSKFRWAEASATAVYIKNRLPHSALPKQQTPCEALEGDKPSIKHLQPFGRKCYVHIPEEAQPSGRKLLPRAIEGRFLGYEKAIKYTAYGIQSNPTKFSSAAMYGSLPSNQGKPESHWSLGPPLLKESC